MAPVEDRKIYSGKLPGALMVSIGALALGCGIAVSFVATDPLLAILLMGLPSSVLGCLALLAGIAALSARVEISRAYLSVAAPHWRGCPLPPVRKVRMRWDAITALRHRSELYHLLPGQGLPFPVDAYAIETDEGRVIFAGKSIPRFDEALGHIALRSGRSVQEEPPVQASILGSFLKGAPRWG